MALVRETYIPFVFVRVDGLVSLGDDKGPWTPGTKHCVNGDMVRLKGHVAKYYYSLFLENQTVYVHRLVAATFCENPCPLHFRIVDHIDQNSLNNAASNLRWINNQLNLLNKTCNNAYFAKRPRKWRALVTCQGVTHRWGMFKTFKEAHLSAQEFKAAKFAEIYRSFVLNETPTSRAGEHIHGAPLPTGSSKLPVPGVRGSGVLWPHQLYLRPKLPQVGEEEKTAG